MMLAAALSWLFLWMGQPFFGWLMHLMLIHVGTGGSVPSVCTFANKQWSAHVQQSAHPGFTRSVAVVVAYLIRCGTVSHHFAQFLFLNEFLKLSRQLRFTFGLPDLFINLSNFHYLSTTLSLSLYNYIYLSLFSLSISIYQNQSAAIGWWKAWMTRAARLVKHLDLPQPVALSNLDGAVAMCRYIYWIYLSIYLIICFCFSIYLLVCLSIVLSVYLSRSLEYLPTMYSIYVIFTWSSI